MHHPLQMQPPNGIACLPFWSRCADRGSADRCSHRIAPNMTGSMGLLSLFPKSKKSNSKKAIKKAFQKKKPDRKSQNRNNERTDKCDIITIGL
jgi:hypothetical protein